MPEIGHWKETGVAKLVGSFFCFYFLIFIATFHAQLKETRDPNDSVHVPSLKAVQSLFHQNRDLLGEKMVLFPPEVNEAKKVVGKL